MLSEVYDALRDIGVSEDKARRVAEAMATDEPQFAAIRADIGVLRSEIAAVRSDLLGEIAAVRSDLVGEIATVRNDLVGEIATVRTESRKDLTDFRAEVDRRFADVLSDFRVLKWQVGALFALFAAVVLPTFWLVFRIAAKTGAIGF